MVVGSAGFLGVPRKDRSVELGFGIQPKRRNLGYASEAARALVGWALEQSCVERVFARCEPTNRASIRVLEKIGMSRRGTSGQMLLWQATTNLGAPNPEN